VPEERRFEGKMQDGIIELQPEGAVCESPARHFLVESRKGNRFPSEPALSEAEADGAIG
jgi:hypothetical protein